MRSSNWLRGAPLEALIADRLHSASIHLLRRLRKLDTSTGVGPARLSVLSVLVFAGPLSLKDLAAAEQVRPATMSPIVGGLKRDGLVRTVGSSVDRRSIQIRATRKGIRVLTQGRRRRIEFLARQLKKISAGDLKILEQSSRILKSLLEIMD